MDGIWKSNIAATREPNGEADWLRGGAVEGLFQPDPGRNPLAGTIGDPCPILP